MGRGTTVVLQLNGHQVRYYTCLVGFGKATGPRIRYSPFISMFPSIFSTIAEPRSVNLNFSSYFAE